MGLSIRRARDSGTASVSLPSGAITQFAGLTAPSGWLLCGGQEVPISSYPELYGVLGTTYGTLTNGSGGAGSSHFRLPDLRGRVPAGKDDMGGSAASRLTTTTITSGATTLGNAGGAQTHTLSSAESGTPAHQHPNTLSNATVGSSGHTHMQSLMHSSTNGGAGMIAYAPWNDAVWGISGSQYTYTNRQGFSMAGAEGTSVTGYPYLTSSPSASTTVGISNVNNTAANASTGHNNVQPTLILNYIIKV